MNSSKSAPAFFSDFNCSRTSSKPALKMFQGKLVLWDHGLKPRTSEMPLKKGFSMLSPSERRRNPKYSRKRDLPNLSRTPEILKKLPYRQIFKRS